MREFKLENGAILVADVHYKKGDKLFLDFLDYLIKSSPPQVIFLGDIFHLLLPFDYLKKENFEAISKINKLAKNSKVYYICGNHDFLIKDFFDCEVDNAFFDVEKSVILTHGDLFSLDKKYNIYVRIIRSIFVLKALHFITLNFVNNWLFKAILKKRIKCEEFKFEEIVKKRIKLFDFKTIIEGHYHQGGEFEINGKKYYNLKSFYCSKKYYVYQNSLKELTYEH